MTSFRNISPAGAHNLLSAPDTKLIDIRDTVSFEEGHIEHAVRIDNDNVGSFIATANKTSPLIVCCYHGISSQNAAQFFVEQGVAEVYSLSGGFEEWKTLYPVVRG